MNPRPFRIWRVFYWTLIVGTCGYFAFQGLQRTEWYKDRLFHQLEHGSPEQRQAAAMTLTRVKAEDYLLRGLQSTVPEVRELSRRGVEHIWYAAAGYEALDILSKAIEASDEGEPVESLEILNRLIRQYPDFAEAWNRRASLYWELGEYENSIEDCRQVLKLNPNHYGAWQGIGVCYLEKGDVRLAVESLKAALRIIPHDTMTRRSLEEVESLLRTFPAPETGSRTRILL